MQMIAAVIVRQKPRRMARITQHRIEIDHRVKFALAANPSIDLLPHGFLLRSGIAWKNIGAFEWRQSSSNNSDALFSRFRDELPIPNHQLLRSHLCGGRRECAWKSYVIDAETHDDTVDSGLPQCVTRETGYACLAQCGTKLLGHLVGTVVQQPIANQAFIQNTCRGAATVLQSHRPYVRPAVIRIWRYSIAIDSGISERDDDRCVRRRHHTHAG